MISLSKKTFFVLPVLFLAALLVSQLSFVFVADAQQFNGGSGGTNGTSGNTNGSSGLTNGSNGQPNGSSGGNIFSGTGMLKNPLAVSSICGLIVLLLQAAIAIGIPIAVLFIVWAGFKFILARGNPGELSEARSNFVAVIIGIAIFLGASLIANVLMATLGQLGVTGITDCRTR